MQTCISCENINEMRLPIVGIHKCHKHYTEKVLVVEVITMRMLGLLHSDVLTIQR